MHGGDSSFRLVQAEFVQHQSRMVFKQMLSLPSEVNGIPFPFKSDVDEKEGFRYEVLNSVVLLYDKSEGWELAWT